MKKSLLAGLDFDELNLRPVTPEPSRKPEQPVLIQLVRGYPARPPEPVCQPEPTCPPALVMEQPSLVQPVVDAPIPKRKAGRPGCMLTMC
ncbi:hypothetical protein RIE95_10165 [Acidithiobacillus thiooxidans]|uniref:hypothetical protein n=1 Tax=Acidithiobacillus thiooxidans TaxID=930 RepID=UPI00285B2F27|nr:hypothetical protein [Acidithiobacillus thiooxidans]MDR7927340.1 hypothetical protein [Acidithiobacillus thiooxidans]